MRPVVSAVLVGLLLGAITATIYLHCTSGTGSICGGFDTHSRTPVQISPVAGLSAQFSKLHSKILFFIAVAVLSSLLFYYFYFVKATDGYEANGKSPEEGDMQDIRVEGTNRVDVDEFEQDHGSSSIIIVVSLIILIFLCILALIIFNRSNNCKQELPAPQVEEKVLIERRDFDNVSNILNQITDPQDYNNLLTKYKEAVKLSLLFPYKGEHGNRFLYIHNDQKCIAYFPDDYTLLHMSIALCNLHSQPDHILKRRQAEYKLFGYEKLADSLVMFTFEPVGKVEEQRTREALQEILVSKPTAPLFADFGDLFDDRRDEDCE